LPEFPDLTLRLAGNISRRAGYGQFLLRRIKRMGLSAKVHLLDYIDAETMAREMTGAHVYAIATYSDNSSNSLSEAMLVGMPCVASYTGGLPSLVEDGRTGLLFQTGRAAVLAERLREVFRDDDLATRLGRAAKEVAAQ